MNAGATPPPAGLLAALRALGATLAETAGVRGSLFVVELREEVERRKQMLALGAMAFVLLHTALLLATALVVIVFWETHRIAAVAGMAALYGVLGAGALYALRRRIAASPAPFAATREELARDFEPLRAQP